MPCNSHHYEVGQPFDGVCRICWLRANRPDYAKLWSQKPPKLSPSFTIRRVAHGTIPPPQPPLPPCFHLGPAPTPLRTETCQFCGNREKQIPIYACTVWGECSLRPYRAGAPEQSCKGCEQYTSHDPSIVLPFSTSSSIAASNAGGSFFSSSCSSSSSSGPLS